MTTASAQAAIPPWDDARMRSTILLRRIANIQVLNADRPAKRFALAIAAISLNALTTAKDA